MLDPEMQGRRLRWRPSARWPACWRIASGSTSAAAGGSPIPTWRSWVWSAPTTSRSTSLRRTTMRLRMRRPSCASRSAETRRKAFRVSAGSPAPGAGDHDRRARPANVEAIGNAIAPEPARAVVDLATGEPARRGGAHHRRSEARRRRPARRAADRARRPAQPAGARRLIRAASGASG